MIDWDEISRTESEDDLKKLKIWLFKENIRLENERRELAASREAFLEEKTSTQKELDMLNQKTMLERKRLKEESLFFEKKMDILQNGFRQLEEDRRSFEQQKKAFMAEQTKLASRQESSIPCEDVVQLLFRTTNNSLALRKRYRDLVKIFHPDNLFGDAELVQMINREYAKRKENL